MPKNIVLFSPHYPPQKGGVSDYTLKLKEQLSRLDHRVFILTKKVDERVADMDIFEVDIPAQQLEIENMVQTHQIDDFIVQYTPLAFNPHFYGLNFWLIRLLKSIKNKTQICLYVHEAHYPINLTKVGLTIGVLHVLQFYFLCRHGHKIIFSTKSMEETWRKRMASKSHLMSTLPIGSNILPPASFDPKQERENLVVYFGGHHDTQYNQHAFKFMVNMAIQDQETSFIILGLKEYEIPDVLRERTRFPGYLPESEVSLIYQRSRLALLPLMDGCSTRRSTLMCAMAHAVPVVTNIGYCSDPSIPWSSFCFIKSLDEFHHVDTSTFSKDHCQTMGLKAFKYYQDHFNMDHNCKYLIS